MRADVAEPARHLPPPREKAARAVLLLTLLTMAAELVVGYASGSMALVADGWHMLSHATAMLLAWIVHVAVRRARRHGGAGFTPARLSALGGYTSALLLTGFAAHMAVESIDRLRRPIPVLFEAAIVTAVVGLVVNLVSVKLLAVRAHEDDAHADHSHRAAVMHVAADALTSVLAIVALLAGRYAGWGFLDPTTGLVGAALVAWWAAGLIRASARTLVSG
jgi:cation diffusion facilitator family transporter